MKYLARTPSTWLMLVALNWLGGCAPAPINPSFPLSIEDADAALAEMEKRPAPLARPVVIFGGYFDPGFGTMQIEKAIRQATGDDRVISVSFFAKFNFERCREHAIRSIEEAFPSGDPEWTTEVDVIAGSMGGIVARFAALPPHLSDVSEPLPEDAFGQRTFFVAPGGAASTPAPASPPRCPEELAALRALMQAELDAAVGNHSPHKRLKIARLFTVSTPHRGASLAMLPTFDSLVIDQRPGSDLLARLDAALPTCGYPIFPYVRLNDQVVGCANAAPPGRSAWWVSNPPLQFSHINSLRDRRIIADIARRLRGETPFATNPPAPLPVPPAVELK